MKKFIKAIKNWIWGKVPAEPLLFVITDFADSEKKDQAEQFTRKWIAIPVSDSDTPLGIAEFVQGFSEEDALALLRRVERCLELLARYRAPLNAVIAKRREEAAT